MNGTHSRLALAVEYCQMRQRYEHYSVFSITVDSPPRIRLAEACRVQLETFSYWFWELTLAVGGSRRRSERRTFQRRRFRELQQRARTTTGQHQSAIYQNWHNFSDFCYGHWRGCLFMTRFLDPVNVQVFMRAGTFGVNVLEPIVSGRRRGLLP